MSTITSRERAVVAAGILGIDSQAGIEYLVRMFERHAADAAQPPSQPAGAQRDLEWVVDDAGVEVISLGAELEQERAKRAEAERERDMARVDIANVSEQQERTIAGLKAALERVRDNGTEHGGPCPHNCSVLAVNGLEGIAPAPQSPAAAALDAKEDVHG